MVKGKANPIMAYKPLGPADPKTVQFLSRDVKANYRMEKRNEPASVAEGKKQTGAARAVGDFDLLDSEIARDTFVGRSSDMQSLEDSLRDVVRTGENHVVLIEGEPGMGRTTLSRQFLRRTRQNKICSFYGKGIPPSISPDNVVPELSPFREMVADLWGGLRDDSDEAKERLEESLEGEGFDNASLFNALLDLRVPETRPASMLTKNARRKRQIDLIVGRVNQVCEYTMTHSHTGSHTHYRTLTLTRIFLAQLYPNEKVLIVEDINLLDAVSWNLVTSLVDR